LGNEGRVFVLTRSAEQCSLYKESRRENKEFDYYVLDDDNTQLMLVSNKLRKGETDLNPLATAIVSKPPKVGREIQVNYEDQIELIGVDIPESVDKGSTLTITFYYKILKKVSRPWKVFAHIDGPSSRVIGDHKPVGGLCSLSYFMPGDYVIDRFEVKAGGVTDRAGMYKIWAGFFVGSAGNYTNMKVMSGNADKDNRVHVGSVRFK
jgi:hypothetical protein